MWYIKCTICLSNRIFNQGTIISIAYRIALGLSGIAAGTSTQGGTVRYRSVQYVQILRCVQYVQYVQYVLYSVYSIYNMYSLYMYSMYVRRYLVPRT